MEKNNKVDNSNYPKQSTKDNQYRNQEEYIDTGKQDTSDQNEGDTEERVKNEAQQDSQSRDEQHISDSKRKPSERDYVEQVRPNMKK